MKDIVSFSFNLRDGKLRDKNLPTAVFIYTIVSLPCVTDDSGPQFSVQSTNSQLRYRFPSCLGMLRACVLRLCLLLSLLC